MPPVWRWQIYDPQTDTTLRLPINPNSGNFTPYEKNITDSLVTAPEGRAVLFEGAERPKELSFSGVILEESHHQFLVSLFNKHHQLRLTDDLGQIYWIYITKFAATRRRSHTYPWYANYELTALIVDWAE